MGLKTNWRKNMSILEDLYNGEVAAYQRPAAYWKEVENVVERIDKLREKLRESMTEPQQELLEKLEDTLLERYSIEERYVFIIGFRMAARIMAEALAEEA